MNVGEHVLLRLGCSREGLDVCGAAVSCDGAWWAPLPPLGGPAVCWVEWDQPKEKLLAWGDGARAPGWGSGLPKARVLLLLIAP